MRKLGSDHIISHQTLKSWAIEGDRFRAEEILAPQLGRNLQWLELGMTEPPVNIQTGGFYMNGKFSWIFLRPIWPLGFNYLKIFVKGMEDKLYRCVLCMLTDICEKSAWISIEGVNTSFTGQGSLVHWQIGFIPYLSTYRLLCLPPCRTGPIVCPGWVQSPGFLFFYIQALELVLPQDSVGSQANHFFLKSCLPHF